MHRRYIISFGTDCPAVDTVSLKFAFALRTFKQRMKIRAVEANPGDFLGLVQVRTLKDCCCCGTWLDVATVWC